MSHATHSNLTILFRADAGPGIGVGHLMRSSALAQAAMQRGWSVHFVSAEASPSMEIVKEMQIPVHILNEKSGSDEDAKATMQLVKKLNAKWIVVDGYAFDTAYQKAMRDGGMRLLVIDDYAHLDRYEADILFNQNISASKDLYEGKVNKNTTLLLGLEYVLLRKMFTDFRKAKHTIPKTAQNILITLGGSSPVELLQMIIEALSLLQNYTLYVLLALGSESTESADALKNIVQAAPHRVEVTPMISDMPEKMQWADLAIVAGGSTNWELLYMGVPAIVGTIAKNQEKVAEGLGNAALAKYVGWYKDCRIEELCTTIDSLISSAEKRRSFSARGQTKVDGKGAERVLDAMLHLSSL